MGYLLFTHECTCKKISLNYCFHECTVQMYYLLLPLVFLQVFVLILQYSLAADIEREFYEHKIKRINTISKCFFFNFKTFSYFLPFI